MQSFPVFSWTVLFPIFLLVGRPVQTMPHEDIKAQMASGHTDHFTRLFQVHRAEYTEAVRRQNQDAAAASPAAAEQ